MIHEGYGGGKTRPRQDACLETVGFSVGELRQLFVRRPLSVPLSDVKMVIPGSFAKYGNTR
jgi:hypothetical protein